MDTYHIAVAMDAGFVLLFLSGVPVAASRGEAVAATLYAISSVAWAMFLGGLIL